MTMFNMGCYTSGGTRGKLSDAMDKASDKNTGSRKVETHPPSRPVNPETYRDTIAVYPTPDSLAVRHDTATGRAILVTSQSRTPSAFMESAGLNAGSGTMKSTTYYGMTRLGVSYELFNSASQRYRIDFNLRASSVPIQQTSHLSESLKGGVVMLQAGADYNYFTTPPHTFMGHYLFCGVHYTYMVWRYKNAIIADEYDDYGNRLRTQRIDADALQGLDVSVGMGWNPVQVKWFNIGFEASPGVILWDTSTQEGFDNDVFPILTYLSLNATVKLNFKS